MELDARLRALAEGQHGVIARAQARGLGANRHHLRRRTESMEWEAITSRVLRLVGAQRTFRQRAMAATLDAGPGAALSHESAATLWRLPGFSAGALDVSRAVGRSAHRSALAELHRTCRLPEAHVLRFERIPVTTPARTIFDLAGALHPGRTERALDNALARRLTTVASLRAVTDDLARQGRPGSGLMRRLLAERAGAYVPPESNMEARLNAVAKPAASTTSSASATSAARSGSAGSTSSIRRSGWSSRSTATCTTARCSTRRPTHSGTPPWPAPATRSSGSTSTTSGTAPRRSSGDF